VGRKKESQEEKKDNDIINYYEDRGESVAVTERPGAEQRRGRRGAGAQVEELELPRRAVRPVVIVMDARSDSLRERCISASS